MTHLTGENAKQVKITGKLDKYRLWEYRYRFNFTYSGFINVLLLFQITIIQQFSKNILTHALINQQYV